MRKHVNSKALLHQMDMIEIGFPSTTRMERLSKQTQKAIGFVKIRLR